MQGVMKALFCKKLLLKHLFLDAREVLLYPSSPLGTQHIAKSRLIL